MQIDLVTIIYVAGGVVLPAFYLPQIRRCQLDDTGLVSYSLTKSLVQCTLRILMLPFVLKVGNDVMSAIVLLDTLGRVAELFAAVGSLRRQGWTVAEIAKRLLPRAAAYVDGLKQGGNRLKTAPAMAPQATGALASSAAPDRVEPVLSVGRPALEPFEVEEWRPSATVHRRPQQPSGFMILDEAPATVPREHSVTRTKVAA